ncbi:hypothetical protein [Novosphingobium sp.]|uniref:hypothetical protein n=1 Tax=Novosphingobium sp. TaxID=1874826 RepID=UPI002FDF0466
MHSYTPQTHREDQAKASIKRAHDTLSAERAADPKAHEEAAAQSRERAARYQRMAKGGRA